MVSLLQVGRTQKKRTVGNLNRQRCFGLTVGQLIAVLGITVSLVLLSVPNVGAQSLDDQTRIELQIGLQAYISNKRDGKSVPFFDSETGTTWALKLKSLHPKIFKNGDYFLMCADFEKKNGDVVLIDYVVRRHHDGFRVEQELRGRRSYLTKIFERVF